MYSAIFGSSIHARMRVQRSYFTFHRDILNPLEKEHPDVLDKIVLNEKCLKDAIRYLIYAGVNEYSLFPDLEGLVRNIMQEEFDLNRLFLNKQDPNIEVQIRDFGGNNEISKKIMRSLVCDGIPKAYFNRGRYDETSEKNEAILIGRKFPVALAKKIIRKSREFAPFLKYVRHYDGSEHSIMTKCTNLHCVEPIQ